MSDESDTAAEGTGRRRLLLVTGLLGAGKTTALKVLEDLGWETIDNFPIRLLHSKTGNRPYSCLVRLHEATWKASRSTGTTVMGDAMSVPGMRFLVCGCDLLLYSPYERHPEHLNLNPPMGDALRL